MKEMEHNTKIQKLEVEADKKVSEAFREKAVQNDLIQKEREMLME